MKNKTQLELGIGAESKLHREKAENPIKPPADPKGLASVQKIVNADLASAIERELEACEPSPVQEVLALILHHGHTLFRAGEMKRFFGGSKDLFHECRDAGWLTPVVSGNRMIEYHLQDIAQCLRRLRTEGRPSRSSRAQGRKS